MLLSGDRSTAVLLRRFASLYDAPSPSFGKARVFTRMQPATNAVRVYCWRSTPSIWCGAQRPEDYVNDRPYVSSSYIPWLSGVSSERRLRATVKSGPS